MFNLVLLKFKFNHKTNTYMEPQANGESSPVEITPKVTGIGGVFFFTDNVQETKAWYAKNLGFEIDDWGASLPYRDVDNPEQVIPLQWSPFKRDDAYFSPSEKDFMINYRVQNIEGMISKLKENSVTILDDIASYDYGKFVHIMDADGNKIELWEPA
jgi:predicted enzyme related to lactoylglutathione lyase